MRTLQLTEAEHQHLLYVVQNLLNRDSWLGYQFLFEQDPSDRTITDLQRIKVKLGRAERMKTT